MNRTQLVEMLHMQDRLNSAVSPTWLTDGHAWHRALMMESAEALDHYGWKWWKKHEAPDVEQIRLELVDIWHFAMSLVLSLNAGEHALTTEMLLGFFEKLELNPDEYGSVTDVDDRGLFDMLAGTAGASQMFNGGAFLELMKRFGLTWESLYQLYMAKNVLNMFRQANGYKDGTYVKTWDGLEDNVILMGIIKVNPAASATKLLNILQERYEATV